MFRFLLKILPADQHRKLKYITVVYTLSIFFILYFHLQYNFQYKVHTYNWILVPLYFLMLLTPLLARITKKYEIAALNLLLSASLQTIIFIYAAGGIQAPGIFWLSVLPISGGILLGRRGAIIGTILIGVATMVYLIAEYNWIVPNVVRDAGNYEKQKIINLILFYIFSIWIIFYFLEKETDAQNEIRRHKGEIESLLHILIHDVASPLAAQELEILRMKKKSLDPDLEKSVMRLERSTNMIVNLLGQIKEMKSLKDGKIGFQKKPINFEIVYNGTIDGLSNHIQEKQIEFISHCDVKNCFILGDEILLQSIVLNNLITNAIKFSREKGKIVVNAHSNAEFVYFEIQDFGIGMPAHILNNIFNLAYPTSRAGTKGEKGTGYGMPLVKEYVDKMNGQITINSVEAGEDTGLSGTRVILKFSKY